MVVLCVVLPHASNKYRKVYLQATLCLSCDLIFRLEVTLYNMLLDVI